MAEYKDINGKPVDFNKFGNMDTGDNIPYSDGSKPGRTVTNPNGYVANTPDPMASAARKEQLLAQQREAQQQQQKVAQPQQPVQPQQPANNGFNKYEDYEKDIYSYISNPEKYAGPNAEIYGNIGSSGLKDFTNQVRNLQMTSSSGGVPVTDVVSHMKGAIELANATGQEPGRALFNLTAVARAAENGGAKEGIDYFLVTGQVKNKAAAQFSQVVDTVSSKLEDGSITEEEAEDYLDRAIVEITGNEKLFDRKSNVSALVDGVLQLVGYGAGAAAGKALQKFGPRIANALSKSKIVNKATEKFANTKIGKKFVDGQVSKYMDDLAKAAHMENPDGTLRGLGEGVSMSPKDAKVIQAATKEDEDLVLSIIDNLKANGLSGKELDDAFEATISKLPRKSRAAVDRVLKSMDKMAEVDPKGFEYAFIDANVDPTISANAFKNKLSLTKQQISKQIKWDTAEMARFLRGKNAEQASANVGAGSNYLAGTKYGGVIADLLAGANGKSADEVNTNVEPESVPLADASKKVSTILPEMPAVTSVLDDEQKEILDPYMTNSEKAHKKADEEIAKTGGVSPETEEEVLRADEQLRAAIENIQSSIAKGNPERLSALKKDLGEIDDTSVLGMPKTWLGAYFAGEFGPPKTANAKRTLAFFALDALGNALLNSSAVIQKRSPEKSMWQKAQSTRLENAYNRFNLAKQKGLESSIDTVVDAYKLDMDTSDNLRRLFADTNLKNYYNKLDDTRKLELVEKVARYAPLFNRFNDDQLALFTKLMMSAGMVNRDELNLMLAHFRPSDIASILANTRKSAERVAGKQLLKIDEEIKQAAANAKLTNEQANLYRIKVYSDIASGAGESAMDIIKNLAAIGAK